MDAFQILVVVLAVALAVFLALGIILLILSIKVTLKINRITENVEDASDSFRSMMSTLNQWASPAVAAKIIVKYIRSYINNKRRSDDD